MGNYRFIGGVLSSIRIWTNIWDELWWVSLVFFRAFPVFVLGERAYFDEHSHFRCDTNQPGCSQVCFNAFSPISYLRFWGYMLAFAAMPGLFYHGYAMIAQHKIWSLLHEEDQLKEEIKTILKEMNEFLANSGGSSDLGSVFSGNLPQYTVTNANSSLSGKQPRDGKFSRQIVSREYYEALLAANDKKLQEIEKQKKKIGVKTKVGAFTNSDWDYDRFPTWEARISKYTPKMKFWYVVHVMCKLLVELIFISLSYWMSYQQSHGSGLGVFTVPELFYCGLHEQSAGYKIACGQAVKATTCWSSRPMEKTFFLWYQLAFQVFSVVVLSLELCYFSWVNGRKRGRRMMFGGEGKELSEDLEDKKSSKARRRVPSKERHQYKTLDKTYLEKSKDPLIDQILDLNQASEV